MGRKSRRNDQVVAVPEIAPVEVFPTAIYARLSVENSGKDDGGASIANQIEFCKEYIEGCPHLQLVKVYQDNGYTGTVMHRPAFDEMMEDVKSGIIKAIAVRDLSRFSRNYIETGMYLEKIFPKLNVRFISIKENFDTFTTDGSAESLMIPLQSLINDLYSKDISRKVEAALHVQMENGEFNWRRLPYGFRWNEEHTEIVPYEPEAKIVRQIYEWKLEGKSATQIAFTLRDMQVPRYHYESEEEMYRWCSSGINAVLRNPAYIGKRVYGVRHSAIYKGVKLEKMPEEAWHVQEDAHEGIVDTLKWNAVQAIMNEDSKKRKESMAKTQKDRDKIINLFQGRIFCADCGRPMYLHKHRMDGYENRWYGAYDCASRQKHPSERCASHNIQKATLDPKVLEAIRLQVKSALDYEDLIARLRNTKAEKSIRNQLNNAISSVSLRMNGLQKKRTRLYEDYIEGILDEAEYTFAKKTYDDEYEMLDRQLNELMERRNAYMEAMSSDNKWITLMKGVRNAKKLTQELVDTVVDRVLVYEDRSIEVIMKYQDVYELTVRYTDEIRKEAEANG